MTNAPAKPVNNTCAYRFNRAIVRSPSRSVVNGLRAGDGSPPDYEGVTREHAAYIEALRAAGLGVSVLGPLEAFPDSVFVEDPALVFGHAAILLRPGAASRFGESAAIEADLRSHFVDVIALDGDGFADGGDVLWTGREVMIGLSDRTDERGAQALCAALATLGLAAKVVCTPAGVLHFKSDCSVLGDRRILATRRLAASGVFDAYEVVLVPEGEEAAANALRINDRVLLSDSFPTTRKRLEALGFDVVLLATREIQKVDAGLSCMSLRYLHDSPDAN